MCMLYINSMRIFDVKVKEKEKLKGERGMKC